MSDGTRFVVYLLTAWAAGCFLFVGMLVVAFWVFGLGIFAP